MVGRFYGLSTLVGYLMPNIYGDQCSISDGVIAKTQKDFIYIYSK